MKRHLYWAAVLTLLTAPAFAQQTSGNVAGRVTDQQNAAIPGATVPDLALLPRMPAVDLGPEADRGVGRYPAEIGPVSKTLWLPTGAALASKIALVETNS